MTFSFCSRVGGIVDGRGVAAALVLGADGVMMGTRFLASTESLASDELKQKLVRATGTNV
jgi:nitronate monooxygenase